ncbi:hypothetical protein C5L14_19720 [Labrys okinawensis]|uniref:FAD synthase n=1 Tax=Labrys okinawensis TaxID=346911 RepID=A0A2S9Q920_9HYPH|nr:hypothetical protein [Labrys okinawensis]PRH85784.1 hypothetical protein C5L14_19720 [Labrys okinawensis]
MAWTQPIQHEPRQPAGHGRLRHVADRLPASDPDRGAVLLLGNFDGFHRGHHALLDAAERIAGEDLPLGVMSCEPHPRSFFRRADCPFRLTTPTTKAHRFAALGFDYVFSPIFDAAFASLTPAEFAHGVLKQGLGVSHAVIGDDFRFGRSRAGDADLLARLGRSLGFGVTRVPEISANARRCSSSQVRAFLRAGDIRAANGLLGTPWLVEAVASGGQLALSPTLCRPPAGLYLCWTGSAARQLHLSADGVVTADQGASPAAGLLRFLDRLA